MKRYIRFKVKHIFATLGIVIGIVMISYIFLPSILFSIGDNYQSNGESETAKVYFDRIDQYFPRSGKTAEALERAAEISNSNNLIMITPRSIGGFSRGNSLFSEEAEVYYRKLAERFPRTWQGKRAIAKLTTKDVIEAISNHRIDEAVTLTMAYYTTETHNRNRPDVHVSLDIAHAMKVNGYYSEAITILDHVLEREENTSFPDLLELLGDLYSILGNKEEATYHYERVLTIFTATKERDREYKDTDAKHLVEESPYYDEKIESIHNKLARLDSTNGTFEAGIVTGTIRLHGNPLSDVQILLQPIKEPGSFPIGSMDALWSVSDHQGNFLFENVMPGEYGLGFAVDLERVGDVILQGGAFPKSMLSIGAGETHHWDFSLVDTISVISPINDAVIENDTIDFSWEPFAGATYYTLKFGVYFENGTSYGQMSEEKYYTNQATLSMDELMSYQSGFSYDEHGPNPQSLFGYANPDGRYFWGVDAHDEDGTVLTSSRGYLASQNTNFSYSKTTMLAADQLLLNRNYGKAIEAYEKLLEQNPNHSHALRMLAAIYKVSGNVVFTDYPYTDYKKAISYYEKLYELTGKNGYLTTISSIYYYSLDDYTNALKTLQRLESMAALTDWQRMEMAKLESHFGNYEEGLVKLLSANNKFYKEEAALRIITDNTYVPSIDQRWYTALQEYHDTYQNSDIRSLLTDINAMPAVDAIDFLSAQNLSPQEAFIKLSLQMVEPSLRRGHDMYIDEFVKAYMSSDRKLTEIAKKLYTGSN